MPDRSRSSPSSPTRPSMRCSAAGSARFSPVGVGLYLRAAIADLEPRPEPAPGERERFEQLYDSDPAAAHRALLERDPAVAAAVHPNDRRRVVRGLELHAAGTTLRSDSASLWETGPRIPTLMVGLDLPRPLGDERIARRTAEMFERGVVDEVRSARDAHVFSTPPSASMASRTSPPDRRRDRRRRGDPPARAPYPPVRQTPAHLDAPHQQHPRPRRRSTGRRHRRRDRGPPVKRRATPSARPATRS